MKRSLRGLVAVAVLALVAGLLVSTTSTSASAGGSISYVYSHSQRSFEAVPNGGGGGDVSAYEYAYTDECVGMIASAFEEYPDDGHTCASLAGNYQCPTPDGGSNGRVVWRRLAGSGGAGERVGGIFCLDTALLEIPLATVTANLREELLRKLHTPVMKIRPDVSTFVNLPNVMWVEGAADDDIVTLEVPAPLTGQVWATASYAWDFGDGSAGAAGRGNPFEQGILPVDDPGHYSVEHTYTQPGTYTVGVVQSWDVFVDIPTYPGGDLDIDAPDEPQTAPITVVPSDAVNISPDMH